MKSRFIQFNSGRVNFFLLAIITVILVSAVLRITASVLLPFTIAVLLAFVTSPIVKFMEKFHIPRIVSALFILFFLFGILFVMGIILYNSGQTIISLYPRYEVRIRMIYIWIARFFELPYDEYISIFENIWGQADIRTTVREMTLTFTNGFISFLTNAFMVSIFMIFLIFEAVFFRQKLDTAFPGPRAERIKRISGDVISQITNYLSVMFFVSILNGLMAGIGLALIGVEFASVWGVIQFVFNFIPNIGSIAAGVGATAFALVQFWPEPGPILVTALVMLGVNILCGFIILPNVMGDRLGLSPLVVLVSLLIWGWLWGFAGLILAVPMMAIIKIVCQNIPFLEPIAVLMGSRKVAMAIRPSEEAQEAQEAGSGETEPAVAEQTGTKTTNQ